MSKKQKDNNTENNEPLQSENSTNEVEQEVTQTNENTSQSPDLDTLLAEEKAKRVQLMADFENYKKRVDAEKSMFGAIANMGLIQELLEISDDINLALSDESLDFDRARESLSNANDKLGVAANNAGVEKIEVKPGDDFNKEMMEAVSIIPDEANANKVISVISSAYKFKDKEGVIKAAKVIVGK